MKTVLFVACLTLCCFVSSGQAISFKGNAFRIMHIGIQKGVNPINFTLVDDSLTINSLPSEFVGSGYVYYVIDKDDLKNIMLIAQPYAANNDSRTPTALGGTFEFLFNINNVGSTYVLRSDKSLVIFNRIIHLLKKKGLSNESKKIMENFIYVKKMASDGNKQRH